MVITWGQTNDHARIPNARFEDKTYIDSARFYCLSWRNMFSVWHRVRTLKAPTCSLENIFRRPGITLRELESLALMVRGDRDIWRRLLVGDMISIRMWRRNLAVEMVKDAVTGMGAVVTSSCPYCGRIFLQGSEIETWLMVILTTWEGDHRVQRTTAWAGYTRPFHWKFLMCWSLLGRSRKFLEKR